jgi:rfaE bifunctional protein kinase chain/domain
MLYEARIDGLGKIADKLAGLRVLVVGDLMLDEYIWGQVNRISPEAPVLVVEAERYSEVPGGAANVVNNLCALGSIGVMVGVVGIDEAGTKLVDALNAEGADTSGIVPLGERPTTRKVRIVAHSQQVVRVDHEKRGALTDETVNQLIQQLERLVPKVDAVLLSDYQKGVLCERVLIRCIELAHKHGKPITGNLKPSAVKLGSDLTLITLNMLEASQAVGVESLTTDAQVAEAGLTLLKRTGAQNILITRGSNGLSLCSKSGNGKTEHVPPHTVAVYDTTGAGDTIISTTTLALAAGADALDAVLLANYAAAEVVKKVGVATVTISEIKTALSRDL